MPPATTATHAATPAPPAAMPRYTTTAIWLHWTMALLLAANIALALTADYFPESAVRTVIDTHKSIGITVLGLVLLRIVWRWRHAPPALPGTYARWERTASHAAHLALYALILALPISGWMHDSAWKDAPTHPMTLFGLVPWPRLGFLMHLPPATKEVWHDRLFTLHAWLAYALYALFALHVAGALKHQWLDGERELQRMWPK